MFERLLFISDWLLVWLVTTSIQISIVGVAIAILDRLVERRVWPQVRAAMWWLLVASLVVGPLLKSPLSVWRTDNAISKVGETILGGEPMESSLAQITTGDANSRNQGADAISARSVVKWSVIGGWLVGVVVCSAVAYWRSAQIRRRWINGGTDAPAWLDELFQAAAQKIGLRHLPRIVVSDAAPGPAVVGALRSVVMIPTSIVREADREQLEHVLLHELAHVRRHDVLASRFCQLVQIVYWFHPMVRLARRQLDTLREICCDETVARAMRGGTESYRRTLLSMARTLLDSPTPAAVGFVHHHSQIMARLSHLERPLTNHPRMVRGGAAMLFALLLVCCVPQVQSLAPRLKPTVANTADWAGCMQLRFAVMRALDEDEAQRSGV